MLPVSALAPEPPPIYVPPPPDPGFWHGAWMLLQLQLVPIVVTIPAAIIGLTQHRELHKHPYTMLLGTVLAALWVIVRYCRRNQLTLRQLAGPFQLTPALLLYLAAGVLGLILIEIPVILWLMVRFPFLDPKLDFGIAQSPAAVFLLVVVVAPVSEELIFRGILLRGFAPRYGFTRAALAAAALFALAHLFPVRMPAMFAAAFLLGGLFLRIGTVWPGVFAHAFNNSLAFLAMLHKPHNTSHEHSLQQLGNGAFVALAAGPALLAFAIQGVRRTLRGTMES